MTIPEGAITNDAGQVALKWILNRPAKTLKIDGTQRYYVPTYQQNVAMYWVEEQDVEKILSIREKTCNCNNGTYQQAIVLANLIDYNLHKCGDRNCP
jgi:hypothetical protein